MIVLALVWGLFIEKENSLFKLRVLRLKTDIPISSSLQVMVTAPDFLVIVIQFTI